MSIVTPDEIGAMIREQGRKDFGDKKGYISKTATYAFIGYIMLRNFYSELYPDNTPEEHLAMLSQVLEKILKRDGKHPLDDSVINLLITERDELKGYNPELLDTEDY